MAIFLIMVGFAVNFVCSLIIVVQAFRVSVGWGLATLFIPFAGLVFVIQNWELTKKPFLAGVGGGLLMFLGAIGGAMSVKDRVDDMETRAASRSISSPGDGRGAPEAAHASAAAMPSPSGSYVPPRTAYQPVSTYTPSAYNPPPPIEPPTTDTQAVEDEWARKPIYEQVHVDRATNVFYADKCRKRPENTYRIPKSVALMQGMTEGKCK